MPLLAPFLLALLLGFWPPAPLADGVVATRAAAGVSGTSSALRAQGSDGQDAIARSDVVSAASASAWAALHPERDDEFEDVPKGALRASVIATRLPRVAASVTVGLQSAPPLEPGEPDECALCGLAARMRNTDCRSAPPSGPRARRRPDLPTAPPYRG